MIQQGVDFEKVVSLAEHYFWHMEFLPEYFVLERTIKAFIVNGKVETPEHTRRSIIQSVSIPDLELFFTQLSTIAGTSFELPVPHVTLFSWSDYEPEIMKGLSLNSKADFEKYLKQKLDN